MCPNEVSSAQVEIDDILEIGVCFSGQGAMDAFGFDVICDASLTYVKTRPTILTADWIQLDGQDNSGFVRVGGFHTTPIAAGVTDTLCYVVFRVSSVPENAELLSLTNCVDDLQGCGGGVAPVEAITWGLLRSVYR
jgi:hypothetical protein